MRGYIITIDSIVAVSFLVFALVLIASQNYAHRTPDGIYLKQLTLDTMSVLEKTGRFEEALSGNSYAVYEVIEATPHLSCMEIIILNSKGEVVFTAAKDDCNVTMDLNIQTTSKPVLYDGGQYIAKTKSWIRVGADE